MVQSVLSELHVTSNNIMIPDKCHPNGTRQKPEALKLCEKCYKKRRRKAGTPALIREAKGCIVHYVSFEGTMLKHLGVHLGV